MVDVAPTAAAVAVIPARGGSKRIPRKNVRPFLGVPLLTRTIGLVRASGCFDRVVVSTDDDEIAETALAAGAEVPFRRPAALANDSAPTLPVIEHAVRMLAAAGPVPRAVCCVYATAVLLQADDLKAAHSLLTSSGADYVFTATSFEYPVQRGFRRTKEGGCEMLWPEHCVTRSQDLEPVFHDAGQFYWGVPDAWLEQRPLFGAASRLLVLPHHRVQDIDSPEDWQRAEMIFEMLRRERTGP